jgi:chromosome partitioning protein
MIFAFSNQKGGVGKTTTVMNLGVFLAIAGKRVLLVDSDPQANLTSGLGMRDSEEEYEDIYNLLVDKSKVNSVIRKSKYSNLDIISSSIDLAGAEIEMINFMSRESILKNALSEISPNYDYILIDCPPSLGLLTINALVAAEKVIIPVQAEYYALEGLSQLINTVTMVKQNLNSNLEIGGAVITMFDSRTNLSKEIALELKNFFGDQLSTLLSLGTLGFPKHLHMVFQFPNTTKILLVQKHMKD